MSFILDALKKSETDRQQRSSAEFAGVPTSSDRAGVPRWLWTLGLLLAINLAVLLALMFRSSTGPATLPTTPITEIRRPVQIDPTQNAPALEEAGLGEPTPSPSSFAEQVAEAKLNSPARGRSAAAAAEDSPSEAVVAAEPGIPANSGNSAALPTIYEVVADGTVDLPELHLDIHVYSDVPKDRFVFINMSKQREQSRLAEGPVVNEITPFGVVLEYRGTTFLLPRD